MTSETKHHIDAARQILVGVVPNPTSQIDQITNALIYKFMDDMDQAAIKQGGDPSFFIDDLKNYAWTRLMDARIGNQERMNIYQEALQKFSESKQLPPLFREIFKSAFLPYRSPEVLGLFLKEINYFDYSHPEELGNAYEYLLSVMGSQGDAGQFRTPRHIIDFMVDVVDPTMEDKVLDPACGTGGFLVSSFKHILEQHDGKNIDGTKNKEKPLTPDQKKTLMGNFEGYDIDPGMVRIAQVNMYLHQFKGPKIYNYDTLTMEERWNDKFSVILANPPFMSPKGGVSTHSKFSIPSSRSEVLFVDYIMNHLRPQGRAAVIVPEGIIFQSGTAHKQLRKNLVEDGLCAVISLPSGVFQPYSGVKTSILIFNNELAKQRDEILFIKIENDGFDLGANKRPISKNDLPQALKILKEWQKGKKIESFLDGLLTESGDNLITEAGDRILLEQQLAHYVSKEKIAESGDYNLSGDRYRIAIDYSNAKWPMMELGGVAEILNGYAFKSEKYTSKGIRVIRITNVQKGEIVDDDPKFYAIDSSKEIEKFLLAKNDLLVSLTGNVGRVGLLQSDLLPAGLNQRVGCIRITDSKQILINYIFHVLNTELFEDDCIRASSGVAQKNLSTEWLKKYKIPLPPIEIQEQIVKELDGYQNIITSAKQIVFSWKPSFIIDPNWEKVKFEDTDVIQIIDGDRGANYPKKEDFKNEGYCLFLSTSNVRKGVFDFSHCDFIAKEKDKALRKGKLIRHDVVLTTRGTLGNTAYYSDDILFDNIRINSGMVVLRSNLERILPTFLLSFLNSEKFDKQVGNFMSGSAQPQLPIGVLNKIEISLPPIKIQKQIVDRIESENTLIEGNKKLIEIYEQKTKDALAKLWEE